MKNFDLNMENVFFLNWNFVFYYYDLQYIQWVLLILILKIGRGGNTLCRFNKGQ